ncbi:MAG TPA: TolC family protein, partial [Phnomibacter sp.]|nr:TolC family protein [Phnomibacter sp.]
MMTPLKKKYWIAMLIQLVTYHAIAQTPPTETLSLQDAIGIALQNNFDLQVARNNEEIASIENNWGNAGRLPTVTAAAGYNYSRTNLRQKLANGNEFN